MAENSLKYLAGEIKDSFYVIPVDDKTKKGFSHTAVLAHEMQTPYIKPLFNVLHSTSDVKYAGKSLQFRLKNPRNFIYKGKSGIDVILIDDIATTGLTLNEAKDCLVKNGVNVVSSIVLANLKK